MSSRYERLFFDYNKYYEEGAPVVLVAHALLKDTKTEDTIVQLKFQNIQQKAITAMNVVIRAFDAFGQELQGLEQYQYTDLTIFRGETWGTDTAIILPDRLTRRVEVYVASVIFANGQIWSGNGRSWNKLLKPLSVQDSLKDVELIKQFRIEYGESAQNMYVEQGGIYHCVCGAVNLQEDYKCYSCDVLHSKLQNYSYDELKKKANERVEEEKIKMRLAFEREQNEAIELKKAKKKKRFLIVTIILVMLMCGIFGVRTTMEYVNNNNIYEIKKLHEYPDLVVSNIKMLSEGGCTAEITNRGNKTYDKIMTQGYFLDSSGEILVTALDIIEGDAILKPDESITVKLEVSRSYNASQCVVIVKDCQISW